MIRYGDTGSIPELKKLWKMCFADEDAYINAFFQALYEDGNVLLEEENGVLLGASFFLPGKIYLGHPDTDGKWQDIRYVYALATYPQFRGRGIAAGLLRSAYQAYHAPLIAEPAEGSLVGGFYRPLGFTEAFYLDKHPIPVPAYGLRAAGLAPLQGSVPDGQLFPIRATDYCRIRDAHFQKHGYIRWPVRHAAFAIQEHCNSGGGAFALQRDGREDIFLYYRQEGQLVVTETTLAEEEVAGILVPQIAGECSSLVFTGRAMKPFGKETGEAAVQPVQEETAAATVKPAQKEMSKMAGDFGYCLTGMALGLAPVWGYLNLTLD